MGETDSLRVTVGNGAHASRNKHGFNVQCLTKGGVNGDKIVGRELVGIRLSEDNVSA